jgi:hypothetical protein
VTPAEARRYLGSWRRHVDGRRLKRVGVLTYFGVYAAIFLGAREAVNVALAALPVSVGPEPLPPLAATLGLPVSVAWSVVSFAVALVAVGAVLVRARPKSGFTETEGSELSGGVRVDGGEEGDTGEEVDSTDGVNRVGSVDRVDDVRSLDTLDRVVDAAGMADSSGGVDDADSDDDGRPPTRQEPLSSGGRAG